jgi:soluble cytochrome b562
MVRKVASALLVSLAVGASPVFAFGLGDLTGGGKSDSKASAAVPDEAAQDALVQQFIKARTPEMQAQISFAKAFGLKDQVQLLEAEKKALSSGSLNKDALEKASEVGAGAQKAIAEAQAGKPVLDAEAKKNYSEGLVSLVQAAGESKKLIDQAQKFGDGIKNAGLMQAASLASKLSAGVYVAKETPGYVKSLFDSTKSALTFGKDNGIKAPASADKLDF